MKNTVLAIIVILFGIGTVYDLAENKNLSDSGKILIVAIAFAIAGGIYVVKRASKRS